MRFSGVSIDGCFLIEPEPYEDERGSYLKVFSSEEFEQRGLETEVQQVSLVRSAAVGTIRGIHWQDPPYSEAKVVRCVAGRVFDVCVDVRDDSSTRGLWVGFELTAENQLGVYIPSGCGHGFQALEPESEVIYTSSQPYVPDSGRGVRWDDPILDIEWPVYEGVILSERDRSWPDLELG